MCGPRGNLHWTMVTSLRTSSNSRGACERVGGTSGGADQAGLGPSRSGFAGSRLRPPGRRRVELAMLRRRRTGSWTDPGWSSESAVRFLSLGAAGGHPDGRPTAWRRGESALRFLRARRVRPRRRRRPPPGACPTHAPHRRPARPSPRRPGDRDRELACYSPPQFLVYPGATTPGPSRRAPRRTL